MCSLAAQVLVFGVAHNEKVKAARRAEAGYGLRLSDRVTK